MEVCLVIPVYNEEQILQQSVEQLLEWCRGHRATEFDWRLVIADSQSTDRTKLIAQALAAQYREVGYVRASKRGKGAAIRAGWQSRPADVYCFMDADLATNLSALEPLVAAVRDGYDLVVGSRFHPQSKVERSALRLVMSWGYRLLLKTAFGLAVADAPCGFKAISDRAKKTLLPLVKDDAWFFDSELVILAEHHGCRIKEIPVTWHEPRSGRNKSHVNIVAVAVAYLRQVLELRRRLHHNS